MMESVVPVLLGAIGAFLVTWGFYKAVVERATKDIEKLGQQQHKISTKVDGIMKEVDEKYVQKEHIKRELDHLKSGQDRLENAQSDIAQDVKAINGKVNDVLIILARGHVSGV